MLGYFMWLHDHTKCTICQLQAKFFVLLSLSFCFGFTVEGVLNIEFVSKQQKLISWSGYITVNIVTIAKPAHYALQSVDDAEKFNLNWSSQSVDFIPHDTSVLGSTRMRRYNEPILGCDMKLWHKETHWRLNITYGLAMISEVALQLDIFVVHFSPRIATDWTSHGDGSRYNSGLYGNMNQQYECLVIYTPVVTFNDMTCSRSGIYL